MSTAPTLPSRPLSSRVAPVRGGARGALPGLLLGLAVALGVLARCWSPSALWLDEALSVAIARRPVPELLAALRRDGSPPVYYLLLHAWTALVGTSDLALRALSTLLSLAALPLVWLAGQRLGGPATARAALLLVAVSPFVVRYATEVRMYALVQLLTVAGLLVLLRALERPSGARLLPVAAVAGLLALTHYWALFLLATTAALLLVLRRRGAPAAGRVLLALAAGGLLFLPWLPTFAFQVRRTGTPWAPSPHVVDLWYTVTVWSGGGRGPAVLLSLLLTALALLAVLGRPARGGQVVLGSRPDGTALALLLASAGTVVLGLVAGIVLGAGYAPRYSSVAVLPALLLAALGLRALPPRAARAVLALAVVTGLIGTLPQLGSTRRTQAALTARAVEATLQPGDVVVYCPDQLGPAVSRLLPAGTDQVVYPTLGAPELVDWVDYAERNAAAEPREVARALATRTDGAVWLVSAGGYLTFGRQCEQLAAALEGLRGEGVVVQRQSGRFDEQQAVTRYPSVRTDVDRLTAP